MPPTLGDYMKRVKMLSNVTLNNVVYRANKEYDLEDWQYEAIKQHVVLLFSADIPTDKSKYTFKILDEEFKDYLEMRYAVSNRK